MNESGMRERLLAAVGERSYRVVSELTGTNHESVRRYLQGQAPSAEFLVAVCRSMGINAHWLLTGQGPMRVEHWKSEALRQADPADLLSAMAAMMEALIDRVERLETFLQTMEARLHAARSHARPRGGSEDARHAAEFIAGAVPERPSQVAG